MDEQASGRIIDGSDQLRNGVIGNGQQHQISPFDRVGWRGMHRGRRKPGMQSSGGFARLRMEVVHGPAGAGQRDAEGRSHAAAADDRHGVIASVRGHVVAGDWEESCFSRKLFAHEMPIGTPISAPAA